MTGLIALSRLYHANGFFNEALQCYAGLQRLQLGEARWLHLKASILAGFGRLDEACPWSSVRWSWRADMSPRGCDSATFF